MFIQNLIGPVMFVFIACVFLRMWKSAEANQNAPRVAKSDSRSTREAEAEANKTLQQALQQSQLPALPPAVALSPQVQTAIPTAIPTASPAAPIRITNKVVPINSKEPRPFEPHVTDYDEEELKIPAYIRHKLDVVEKVRQAHCVLSQGSQRRLAEGRAKQRRERRRQRREGAELAASGLDLIPAD